MKHLKNIKEISYFILDMFVFYTGFHVISSFLSSYIIDNLALSPEALYFGEMLWTSSFVLVPTVLSIYFILIKKKVNEKYVSVIFAVLGSTLMLVFLELLREVYMISSNMRSDTWLHHVSNFFEVGIVSFLFPIIFVMISASLLIWYTKQSKSIARYIARVIMGAIFLNMLYIMKQFLMLYF